MITYLYGQVLEVLEDSIWLKVENIGYEIHLHPKYLPQILPDSIIEIYCHTMVSDNDIKLYGFLHKEELLLFRRLMTVSGVGGKAAQAIIAGMPAETLVHAILSEDEKTLTTIPGIGKKMAGRLIFELRDKLSRQENLLNKGQGGQNNSSSEMMGEVMEAMEALGYTRAEIYPLLISLQEEHALQTKTEENIRLLLKRLAGKKSR